jgi:uridine kinase
LGRSRLLAIDGPAGSGKTTLARQVCHRLASEATPVELVSLDELYDGWAGLDESLSSRVVDQLLRPLAHDRTARWQSYDWAVGEFGGWHETAPADVLVVEGCGAGALAVATYTTLLVWVETSADVAWTRLTARDGPGVLDHIAGWQRSEQHHFATNRTRERADVVVVT